MNFGSSYVYNYDHSDEECVSDDEFEEGMTLSDSSDSDEDGYGPRTGGRIGTLGADSPKEKKGFFSRLSSRFSGGASQAQTKEVGGDLLAHTPGAHTDEAVPPAPPPPPVHSQVVRDSAQLRAKKKKLHHWRQQQQQYGADLQQQVPVHGRKWRRADTNVVSVKFDQLIAPSNMHTGDTVYCKGCQAILSHLSKLTDQTDDKLWTCEFCGEDNTVDLVDEEIPKEQDVTYMLKPAPSTTASGKSGTDESLVIFCVDTSGSMCVTTEVPGNIKLRGGERLSRLQSLNDTHEDQYMPGQKRNVTYISRLQGMQAAVDHQLGQMEKEHPNRRIALIAFNNEVTVIGDGSTAPVTIAGDKLSNKEELIKIGGELELPKALKESKKALSDKIFDLEEGGATALGPALLLSISMACQVPGSKVIICTDGLANVGLGNLDVTTDEAYEVASAFYTDVSDIAMEKGASVSVISIKGSDCKMVELGKVADRTMGQVNIVDALRLTEEFGSILADPVIATNVAATLLLHKQLYFRNESTQDSKVVRQVGNVTAETVVTFEYGVRHQKKPDKKATEPTDQSAEAAAGPSASGGASESKKPADEVKEMPFQLQIKYTDLEGAEALRVLTQAKPVTNEREVAEKAMNFSVVGTHVAQHSAGLAMEGKYSESRLNALAQQRLMSNASKGSSERRRHYKQCFGQMRHLENNLNMMQRVERRKYGRTHSDSEDDEEDEPRALSFAQVRMKAAKSKKKQARSKASSDAHANAVYQMKQAKF